MTGVTSSATGRRVFSLAVAAYVVLSSAALCFLFQTFGCDYKTIVLLLILAVPWIVALRMRRRWQATQGREFAFLAVLMLFVLGGSGYAVWYWFDNDFHRLYAEDVRFSKLTREVRADAAFRNVRLSATRFKVNVSLYSITGTVASQSDLDRLKLLAERYGFLSCMDEVKLVGTATPTTD
jgi:hypothetical protein